MGTASWVFATAVAFLETKNTSSGLDFFVQKLNGVNFMMDVYAHSL